MFDSFLLNRDNIDDIIQKSSTSWDIKRIAKVDLSILRVAITEILYLSDIPDKVSINEAIDLAKKYSKTQNQILLNWIVKSKRIWALVKTSNISTAKENLDALNFTLEEMDINILNTFRDKRFDNIQIDRDCKDWIYIWKYPNQVD